MVVFYALVSVVIVSMASLVGVLAFLPRRKNLKFLLIAMISFAAGTLLGDAFIHLLPEMVEKNGFTLQVSLSVIAGIALFFIIEKVLHWRHCHMPVTKTHVHEFGVMNLMGETIHNFLDGVIIATSYLVSIPLGIATTLAVIFHEIPQEIADMGVLVHAGMSKKRAVGLNLLVALTAVAGTLITLIIGSRVEVLVKFLVPLTAGGFIYIACSDLIPELHKGVTIKGSLMQLGMFFLGIGVMALLLLLE